MPCAVQDIEAPANETTYRKTQRENWYLCVTGCLSTYEASPGDASDASQLAACLKSCSETFIKSLENET